jgi:DNA polymerase-3 subunit gamma/tau
MLDKCLSLDPELTIESVVAALGTVDYNIHFDLLFFMETGNKASAAKLIEDVYNSGKDLKQFVKQFQYFVLDVCKFKMFNDFKYVSIPALPEYMEKMQDEDLDMALVVLDWVRQQNSDIKWESNPKAIVQTAIVLFQAEV